MSAVQVVCFDAAETLFTEREGRARMYATEFAARGGDVAPQLMARWMAEAHAELPARVDGQPRYSRAWFGAFVATLLARAGLDADVEAVRSSLERRFTDPSAYVVFGDVFPCLDALLERGLRLAVVSNWSTALPGLLDQLGLGRAFEFLAVSAQAGFDKPDPRLFHWALERLGVPASAACHVGDHEQNDVASARRAGLAAYHLDRSGTRPASPWTLRDLLELPERLSA